MRLNPISFTIFGANTDIGKTICAVGLVKAALEAKYVVNYLKPVQTGTELGHSDEQFCLKYCYEHNDSSVSKLFTKTLYSWERPVSPHVAARESNRHNEAPTDETLLGKIVQEIQTQMNLIRDENKLINFVETAGGVLSPGPSGTPQLDIYSKSELTRKIILVGDGKLGGISTTLTSYESLMNRNFEVNSVVLIEDDASLGNYEFLKSYLDPIKVFRLAPLPRPSSQPLNGWYSNIKISGCFQNILKSIL